jgi:hypothetical protein
MKFSTGIGAVIVMTAGVATAEPYGARTDVAVCAKSLEGLSNEGACVEGPPKDLTAECRAEVDKRIAACKKKPAEAKDEIEDCNRHRPLPDPAKEPDKFCGSVVWDQMLDQSRWHPPDPSVEVPKATMHDAKLEGMIKSAYELDYHGVNKVLKVVLQGWEEEYEKDAFGRITGRDIDATVVNKQPDGTCSLHSEMFLQHGNGRSFSGPFELRGAGSASDTAILCEKVEQAKAAPAPAKKKK